MFSPRNTFNTGQSYIKEYFDFCGCEPHKGKTPTLSTSRF